MILSKISTRAYFTAATSATSLFKISGKALFNYKVENTSPQFFSNTYLHIKSYTNSIINASFLMIDGVALAHPLFHKPALRLTLASLACELASFAFYWRTFAFYCRTCAFYCRTFAFACSTFALGCRNATFARSRSKATFAFACSTFAFGCSNAKAKDAKVKGEEKGEAKGEAT